MSYARVFLGLEKNTASALFILFHISYCTLHLQCSQSNVTFQPQNYKYIFTVKSMLVFQY